MAGRNEPLRRDVADKKIAGVCSGFADYFDVDVTLVRAITASLILLGPAVIVLYAILWWALDEAPEDEASGTEVGGADDAVIAPPPATPTDAPSVVDLRETDTSASSPEG